MSSRLSNMILHQMLQDLDLENGIQGPNGDLPGPNIRNMHRGDEEAYFDIDFTVSDDPLDNSAIMMVDAIKKWIVDNSVQFEDITTTAPKTYKI